MTASPFFSIILPTYNRATFIEQAINSVLTQSFSDFELIIIDDGSTDNTKDIASTYTDERISYHYQENQERSVARNNGIQKAKGLYISFLDSDDYFLPTHLAVLYENIKKRDYPITLFHTYEKYKINGKEKDTTPYDYYKNIRLLESDCRLINNVWLFSPPVQTIAVHKNILSSIHFDTGTIPFECYEFIGRIAASYEIIKINERTVIMQLHENNSTSYTLKFLETSLMAFTEILSNPIYNNIKNHFSVKSKFYYIYIGLADYYARMGEKNKSSQYLLKSLSYKTDLKNIRHILGVTKLLLIPKRTSKPE